MDEHRVEGALESAKGKVKQAVGNAIGDEKTSVEGVADEVSGRLHSAYGEARDRLHDVADRGAAIASKASEKSSRMYHEGNEAIGAYVADRPILALLGAGAIGLLLGFALSSRRD